MAIVSQNETIPMITDPIKPIEYLNEIVKTRTLQIMTHWAKMHIPDDTKSNIYPELFICYYRLMKVRVHKKNENIIGNTNHNETFLKLKSLLSSPYRYSSGCYNENLLSNFSSYIAKIAIGMEVYTTL